MKGKLSGILNKLTKPKGMKGSIKDAMRKKGALRPGLKK
jgi:hypothetical protein